MTKAEQVDGELRARTCATVQAPANVTATPPNAE